MEVQFFQGAFAGYKPQVTGYRLEANIWLSACGLKLAARSMIMNVAVVGGYSCSRKVYRIAQKLGRLIAQEGWVLVCGGGSGVMAAACKGAKEKGGLSVGILPSYDTREANAYLDVKIPTGLGYARNILVVRAADIVVAVDGKYGTLSEIAFALNEGKTVLGIGTWNIKGIIKVKTPQEAIKYIKRKVHA